MTFDFETEYHLKDDTQTAQLRRTIAKYIENYDLQLLKRIAYECRCEEMGISIDSKFLYTDITDD